MENYYLTTLPYNLTKNSPKTIGSKSFELFPDLLKFTNKNPFELNELELEDLFKYLNISMTKNRMTNYKRLYSFMKNKISLRQIIKLREEKAIDTNFL